MKPHNARKRANQLTAFGLALEKNAKEILAHLNADAKLPTQRLVLPDEVDTKRIRAKAGMSQPEFARSFCIKSKNAAGMGQGRRKPDQPPAPT